MSDFIIEYGVLYQYQGAEKDVIIPQGVTHIAYNAFMDCEHVQSITIPQGVTHIERYAFRDCPHLQSLTIPESVIHIEKEAFPKKTELCQCILAPASEDQEQCKMLLNALGTINLAFSFLSDTLETNAILLTRLKTRMINQKFRERFIPWLIDENHTAVLHRLLSITKKISVEELDFYIKISETMPEIRTLLLEHKNKRYPREVLEKMEEIQLEKELGLREKTLTDYKKIFSVKKENNTYLITKYHAEKESVYIPGKINGLSVKLGEKVFYGNSYVTDIFLEEGITEIGNHAFAFCLKLQNLTIPDSVTVIGKSAFQSCINLQTVSMPRCLKKLGDSAFHHCNCLQNIVIPEGLTQIGDFTFHNCTNLKEVMLPQGVTKIGTRAFAYCENLQSAILPDSITEIDQQAFLFCKSLKSVILPKRLTEISVSLFLGCESLMRVSLPDGITRIDDSAFCRCSDLQNISLPNGLKSIGKSAFFGCIHLERFIIPESVTNVEEFSFFDCKNLTLCCSEQSPIRKYAEEEGIPCQVIPYRESNDG